MNEDKLFELLGAILVQNKQALDQNAQALAQHARLVEIIEKREPLSREHLELTNERIRQDNTVGLMHVQDLQVNDEVLKALGISRAEMITVSPRSTCTA